MSNQTPKFFAFRLPEPERLTEEFNRQNPIKDYIVKYGYPTFKVAHGVYGQDVGMEVIVNPVPVRHLCEQEYLYECVPLDVGSVSDNVKLALEMGVIECDDATLYYTGYQLGLWGVEKEVVV